MDRMQNAAPTPCHSYSRASTSEWTIKPERRIRIDYLVRYLKDVEIGRGLVGGIYDRREEG